MKLVPSIVIAKGKVAQISQGDYKRISFYDSTPLDLCKQFNDHGITNIYFVDLDGSKKGEIVNYDILETIANYTDLHINFTGGVHTDGDIVKIMESGAHTVTCATMAVYNPDLFVSCIMSYGREKIALGADSYQQKLRVGGWKKEENIDLLNHISFFYERGLKYLKTSDITKSGLMQGPSIDIYDTIQKRFPNLCLFAAGGISSIDDLYQLKKRGLYGAVIGKAFYEGLITLGDIDKYISIQ